VRPYGPDQPWRLDPAVIQLNHGSYGACPAPVLDAQRAWRERLESDPTRFLSRELTGHLDAARGTVASFLGADPDGLAFVPNATTGVSTVLRSLRFEVGDELLTTDHEYNAILNALDAVARRDGARVVRAAIPLPVRDPGQVVAAILDAVTPRTRLALVSHVTSPTAIVLPIAEIVRELDRRGVDTLVDGAHAPGMVPVDLAALGATYWTGNGHKWLCGPKGSAVLHVRADRRDEIRPLVVSHGWNDTTAGRTRFRKEFDWVGTVDPTAYLALGDAIRIVGALDPGGWPALMAANHELAIAGRDRMAAALELEPPAPDSMLGSMAAFPLPGLASDAAAAALQAALATEDGIETPIVGWPVRAARTTPGDPPRAALLRISAQRYNDASDVDALAAALRRRLA
jgi:isopenicillin-N epimerase